ncbi:MAG TPA: 4'-phosphopantetheinyl transferase superfamily protein [Candidatus Acidoferrum sp.]
MEVYWLEQTEADPPTADDWLSPNEQALLNTMRFAKRRSDWRLGRWTAKNALALYFLYLKLPADPQVFASIEIRSASTGAPEAYFGNQPAAATISLSHRAGIAACAVTMPGVELGCDLETVEPRSEGFVADYFTTAEQLLIVQASAADRQRLVAMLWSAKESTLKASHQGLRLDTRSVIVSPGDAAFELHGWSPMQVHHADRRVFRGWWQHADGMVRTVVAAPPPNPPVLLHFLNCVPGAVSAYA